MLEFVDTNVFMYAIGAVHPAKDPCQRLVESITNAERKAIINVEVLQEVLYRYTAIGKAKIGFDLFDTLIQTFAVIWPITREDLIEAKSLQRKYSLKTRDAIHVATMRRHGVTLIWSYDSDFDRVSGIERKIPE